LVHTVCAATRPAADGDVWLAERVDGTLMRTVALKLPRLGCCGGIWHLRFRAKRDILARLGTSARRTPLRRGRQRRRLPYLAMEYVTAADHGTFDTLRLDIDARLEAVRHRFSTPCNTRTPICHPSRPQAIEHPCHADGQARLPRLWHRQIVGRRRTASETHLRAWPGAR